MEIDIRLLLEIGTIVAGIFVAIWKTGGRTALVEKAVSDLALQVTELAKAGQMRSDSIAKTMTADGCRAKHDALELKMDALRNSQTAADRAVAVLEKELAGIHESMNEMKADIKAILARGE